MTRRGRFVVGSPGPSFPRRAGALRQSGLKPRRLASCPVARASIRSRPAPRRRRIGPCSRRQPPSIGSAAGRSACTDGPDSAVRDCAPTRGPSRVGRRAAEAEGPPAPRAERAQGFVDGTILSPRAAHVAVRHPVFQKTVVRECSYCQADQPGPESNPALASSSTILASSRETPPWRWRDQRRVR